jgi:ribosomal-protein-serine acetyltransferase
LGLRCAKVIKLINVKKTYLTVEEDLTLHLPNLSFAEDLFAVIDENRAYLERHLPWVRQTKSVADSRAFLKNAERFAAGGQQLHLLLLWQQKVIGAVSFVEISTANQTGELGYWIAENEQGQGFITKAAQRLIRYGFEQLALNRITIKVSTKNPQSQKVPQRLGFLHEGTMRQSIKLYEQFLDIELYGLLKTDFLNDNAHFF